MILLQLITMLDYNRVVIIINYLDYLEVISIPIVYEIRQLSNE
jgi:hypothetical protein